MKVSSRRRSVPLSWSVLEWCRGVGVKVVRWPEEQQQQHQQQHSTALSTCPDTLTADNHHIPLHEEEAFGFHAFVWFRKKLSNYLEKCNRLETKQLTKHTTHI